MSFPYFSLYLFTWYGNEISFPYKSLRIMVISGFQSEWSFRSGSKFHSGIMYTENELRSVLENVNRLYIVLSKESGACVSDLTPENALGWVLRICHVNAIRTSLWNESHSQMKVIPVAYKKPLRAYPYPFIYLTPEKGTLFRRNRPVLSSLLERLRFTFAWICTTWPSFPLIFRLLFIASTQE